MAQWTEKTARQLITRTGGAFADKQVSHPKPGIKVWGALDYLIKKHKYIFVRE